MDLRSKRTDRLTVLTYICHLVIIYFTLSMTCILLQNHTCVRERSKSILNISIRRIYMLDASSGADAEITLFLHVYIDQQMYRSSGKYCSDMETLTALEDRCFHGRSAGSKHLDEIIRSCQLDEIRSIQFHFNSTYHSSSINYTSKLLRIILCTIFQVEQGMEL